jgi:hypothetical protein
MLQSFGPLEETLRTCPQPTAATSRNATKTGVSTIKPMFKQARVRLAGTFLLLFPNDPAARLMACRLSMKLP